jgi:opacity protein-like surface antigen
LNHRGLSRLAACSLLALAAPRALSRACAGELAIEGHAGYFRMAASNSGSALFGSDDGATFGGAARYNFWRGAFASAGVRTFSKDGERVFVSAPNAPVQKLGFPLSMTTTPVFLSVGYRFRNGQLIVPYLSAGAAFTKYKETSTVAGESFDVSVSKTGFVGAVGVEVGRGLIRFAAEGGWSTVPNAIGKAGVSQVYGENDIGGKYAIGKLVLAFGL